MFCVGFEYVDLIAWISFGCMPNDVRVFHSCPLSTLSYALDASSEMRTRFLIYLLLCVTVERKVKSVSCVPLLFLNPPCKGEILCMA